MLVETLQNALVMIKEKFGKMWNYYSSHNWEIILQNESAAKIKLSQKLSFESQFTFESKVPPTKKHCKNSGGRS